MRKVKAPLSECGDHRLDSEVEQCDPPVGCPADFRCNARCQCEREGAEPGTTTTLPDVPTSTVPTVTTTTVPWSGAAMASGKRARSATAPIPAASMATRTSVPSLVRISGTPRADCLGAPCSGGSIDHDELTFECTP
jgi:hypothetical protein